MPDDTAALLAEMDDIAANDGNVSDYVRDRIRKLAAALRAATERAERAEAALAESVNLQSHYASLLNQWDGGSRIVFRDVAHWLDRLAETAAQTPEVPRG